MPSSSGHRASVLFTASPAVHSEARQTDLLPLLTFHFWQSKSREPRHTDVCKKEGSVIGWLHLEGFHRKRTSPKGDT